ncbi:MAG: hypothetical protein KGL39_31055 [Patescibacteria group bacterium]|nr:hypothetical protein [Patescibacteria group bacterium]
MSMYLHNKVLELEAELKRLEGDTERRLVALESIGKPENSDSTKPEKPDSTLKLHRRG